MTGFLADCAEVAWWHRSLFPVASLFALPEGTEWAVLAEPKILAFLVRTTNVAIRRHHGLDAVFLEELLHLPLDLRTVLDVGAHPALQDRVGSITLDDTGHDLRRDLFVWAVKSHGADGELGF